MGKVIGIVNQKGGVGKTTTAASLGVGLAKQGKKVLLIDTDPQGSLSAALGYQNTDEGEYVTIADVFGRIIQGGEFSDLDYGILKQAEGVDLVPANIDLAAMEVSMVNVMSRERILSQYIEIIRESYDYVLIDCMPSLGMITINVLTASDSVIIPVQAAYLPIKGLQQLLQTIGRVKKQINPKLEIEGILITLVDKRTRYGKEIEELLRENYGHSLTIYQNTIPISVRAAETPAEGKSIFLYDPKGTVAHAYEELTQVVMEGIKGVIEDGEVCE